MPTDAVARRMRYLVGEGRSAITALGDALAYRQSFEVRVEAAQVLGTVAEMLTASTGDQVLDPARAHIEQAARQVSSVVGDVEWDTRVGRWRPPPPAGG